MPDSSDSPLASVLGEAAEARAAAIAVATGTAATNVDGLAKKALTLSASGEVCSVATDEARHGGNSQITNLHTTLEARMQFPL